MTIFGDDVDQYIDRLEDERDMDTGPWASALKVMLMGAGAATGFGVLKKAKLKAESNSSVPTPAHLPDEITEKYHGLSDFLRMASLSPVSAKTIHTVIQWIEEEENIFNAEDGAYPQMDLLREYPSKVIQD